VQRFFADNTRRDKDWGGWYLKEGGGRKKAHRQVIKVREEDCKEKGGEKGRQEKGDRKIAKNG